MLRLNGVETQLRCHRMSSLRRPTRPKLRERYDRKQQQVIRDAARVFAEHGYDQTTIQDLAQAIDLATGGIYHYVGSKEKLLALICDQLMDPLLERAVELLEGAGEPADQLQALVRLWVIHVIEHRDHMLVFQQERHVIERGAQWRDVRTSRKQFERIVEQLIEKAHAAGQLNLGDERVAISALLGMVNYTAQWYRPRGRLSPIEIADGYIELLLSPLSNREQSPSEQHGRPPTT
jgi:TetR/AcrR family transcriptional regulator, cholesterol catabolism regulator